MKSLGLSLVMLICHGVALANNFHQTLVAYEDRQQICRNNSGRVPQVQLATNQALAPTADHIRLALSYVLLRETFKCEQPQLTQLLQSTKQLLANVDQKNSSDHPRAQYYLTLLQEERAKRQELAAKVEGLSEQARQTIAPILAIEGVFDVFATSEQYLPITAGEDPSA